MNKHSICNAPSNFLSLSLETLVNEFECVFNVNPDQKAVLGSIYTRFHQTLIKNQIHDAYPLF